MASYTYSNDRNHYLIALDNGDRIQYEYDDYGRVTTETFENGDTVTYQYDNSGALATVTDSATGIKTTYYYDFTDRLMKYVQTGTNYSHSVGYDYDSLNNLTKIVETINGVSHETSYVYDDDNRVTTAVVDGVTVTYVYDIYGRITKKTVGSSVYEYIYQTTTDGRPTTQVAEISLSISGNNTQRTTLTYDNMSLLIGVNSVGQELGGRRSGLSAEKFEKIYDMLIGEILEALPNIKIMILEPFVLEATATTATEAEPERWNYFRTEVPLRAAAARRIAEKYGLPFVEL